MWVISAGSWHFLKEVQGFNDKLGFRSSLPGSAFHAVLCRTMLPWVWGLGFRVESLGLRA